MRALVVQLCSGVRAAMLEWVRLRYGRERGTSGFCTLASLAAATVLRNAGVAGVEVGWGSLVGLPHTWLLLPPPACDLPRELFGAYADFYDLTADQFFRGGAPEVAVVEIDHPARGLYDLAAFGAAAEAEVADAYESADAANAEEVVAFFYARTGLAPDVRVIFLGAGA